MSIFRKIARIYFYILSFFYFIIGTTALILIIARFFQFNVFEFLLFPGIIATMFGLTPARLILGTTMGGGPFNLPNPSFIVFIVLGLSAVILSCLGIYALHRISHMQAWIRVWYLIFGIAGIMTIDNLFYVVTIRERGPSISIGIGSVIHLVLLFLGVWVIKKGQTAIEVAHNQNSQNYSSQA